MPDELETTFEFHVGVTELRDSLGFTVQEVARSGNPVVVHRYGREHAALVPLWEWRWLKAIEAAIQAGEIDASGFLGNQKRDRAESAINRDDRRCLDTGWQQDGAGQTGRVRRR